MNHKSIAIIGAGWLGLPLAEHLQTLGLDVLVTATSAEKVAKLTALGMNALCYRATSGSAGETDVAIHQKIFCRDALIICIPPGIRRGHTDYPDIIAQLNEQASAASSQIKQVILCSSTAVYNGLAADVDESSVLNPNVEKTAILAQAEQHVLNSKVALGQVLRLGGLIGPNRHPGRFFKAGKVIPNPESRINFIHQADVIAIIGYLLEHHQTLTAKIINAVAPIHPNRREFYQCAHDCAERTHPEFSQQQEELGKVVHPRVLMKNNYRFQYPDVMTWLQSAQDKGKECVQG